MKTYALAVAFVAAMLFAGQSLAEYVNPIAYPQSGDPTDIQVVIEIPAGTFTKYEIDGKSRYVVWLDSRGVPVEFVADDDSGTVTFTLDKCDRCNLDVSYLTPK